MKQKHNHSFLLKRMLIPFLPFLLALSGCQKGSTPSVFTPSQTPSVSQMPSVSQTPATVTEQQEEDTKDTSDTVSAIGYTLSLHADDSYEISDTLYGLFLEDINFAIDGGLYAEMVKNRSFEYGKMASGGALNGYLTIGEANCDIIDGSKDATALNENNPHYLRLFADDKDCGIANTGYLSGMCISAGETYRFSVYLKTPNAYRGSVTVQLRNRQGTVFAQEVIPSVGEDWWYYELSLTPSVTETSGVCVALLVSDGTVDVDMMSLFPEDTFMGRRNGVRKDLAEALAALSPAFLRFPGGCVIEGETLENAYSWKDSIGNGITFFKNGEPVTGDVAARVLGEDIWGAERSVVNDPYYMSYGFGFYEYFLLCEDLGCEPVPIVNAGLSCQIQGVSRTGSAADAPDVESEEFLSYVQDALDLVEFCKGDASTYWGQVRIAMGHEEPFPLRYIGIGNEQWGNAYFSRYQLFLAALEEAKLENPELYGDISFIVSNGPIASDTYAWDYIKRKGSDFAGLVDEHYYMAPDWFLNNTDRYDSYDRNGVGVFLGEYAAKANTLYAALAEAAYMTGLERNGDIVRLAAYAPLFGNTMSIQWSPDLLWFSMNDYFVTPNYYVQQLFSLHKSDRVLRATLDGHASASVALSGKIGVGTWQTSALFDDITVTSNLTGEVLYSEDFSSDCKSDWEVLTGRWGVKDGAFLQAYTGSPSNSVTGDVSYIGSTDWSDYTLTLKATKLDGDEGFLIPFCVKDAQNFYHWNIGGWNNTVSALEITTMGSKSGQVAGTVKNVKIITGRTYEIKLVVSGSEITGYLDGRPYLSYTVPETEAVYQVSGVTEDGSLLIKLVNVSSKDQPVQINLSGFFRLSDTATVTVLSGDPNASNTLAVPDCVSPVTTTQTVSESFAYTAPAYSLSVLRIPKE